MEHEVTFEGFRTIELPNIPIMQANLPEPVITYLWQLIDVAKANPLELRRYQSGEDKLKGFFMGQIMHKTQGKANPGLANKLIKSRLDI